MIRKHFFDKLRIGNQVKNTKLKHLNTKLKEFQSLTKLEQFT